MGLVDKVTFEASGAHGCSNSDYDFVITTCCERVGVVDEELHDFYFDCEKPSLSLSLALGADCPFCESGIWDYRVLDQLEHVPAHWRWACDGQPRAGRRRIRPLHEHVEELVAFCERVAGPVPRYSTVRFLDTSDPSVRYDGAWRLPKSALLSTVEFARTFEQLLLAGYSWINLSAYGVSEGKLVVGVERPAVATGVAKGLTSVNYSGPSQHGDGSPRWALELTLFD